MFDFENLNVYRLAKELHQEVGSFIKTKRTLEITERNQLKRASLSIILNIAEGSGKLTALDKRRFYYIARGSTYECVALFDTLKDGGTIPGDVFRHFYKQYEVISKMLLGLIQSMEVAQTTKY